MATEQYCHHVPSRIRTYHIQVTVSVTTRVNEALLFPTQNRHTNRRVSVITEWAARDSNPEPFGYEPNALSIELAALTHYDSIDNALAIV